MIYYQVEKDILSIVNSPSKYIDFNQTLPVATH